MYFYALVLPVIIILVGFRTVQQYQRGIVFRFGRIVRSQNPGLHWIIPIFERQMKIDLRTITMPVPPQKIITKDNVSVDVSAVAYYKIVDPDKSIVAIQDVSIAIDQIAQTSLRNIVGKFQLDEILSEREKRAKIIAAEGEFLSAQKLADTADIMMAHPIALQLRNLQTMAEIAVEKNSTIIFPAQFMGTVSDIQNFVNSEKVSKPAYTSR